MTSAQLANHIRKINRKSQFSDYLLLDLIKRELLKEPWYTTQKQHWLRWLKRQGEAGHDAQRVYNRIVCPPMVLWLPEVLISKKALVTEAFTAASKVQSTLTLSARCAAIRCIFPWEMIEDKLL